MALVLHTSGTTSRPKRVPLRHRNLAASVQHIVATYALGPEDVSLCVMPLFHVHGLIASALSTLPLGGTVVVPARFDPLGFWPWWAPPRRHLVLRGADDPPAPPGALGRGRRPPGAESLRFIRSCSSALSPATMGALEDRFGAPVLEAYGMTEASHQMASNPCRPACACRAPWAAGTGDRDRDHGRRRGPAPRAGPVARW